MSSTNNYVSKKIRKIIKENQDMFIALEELDRTGILRKTKYKKRYNFTLDEDLMRQYRNYCRKNSINMSAKIEQLIKKYMKSVI